MEEKWSSTQPRFDLGIKRIETSFACTHPSHAKEMARYQYATGPCAYPMKIDDTTKQKLDKYEI